MEDKILFEIKESHLDTGLRGFPVGTCGTSKVDPTKGLSYRGYFIKELARKRPIEVIYLLLNGELPDEEQFKQFHEELLTHYVDDPGLVKHLDSLPKNSHPMNWFISALNYYGMIHNTKDWRKDALKVIINIPTLVARIYQVYYGWERINPKPELGYMENFVHMISPPNKNPKLIDLMNVFDILHYDHGGGNLSTFVGKAVSSGHADMFESLIGAMCGLAGPLHGKANQECFRFIQECYDAIGTPDDEQVIIDYLEKLLASGKVIFGFGHAVLRVEDTRATILYELGKEISATDPYFNLALKIRTAGTKLLSQKEKISNPYPNVDAVTGTLLNAMGLTDSNFYTVLFGMSRCIGIACQIYHDRVTARNGKGNPIVRPKYIYTGPVR
ncbi:hypothetical protein KUTeg_015674 [Tegillarca granosa]|uniref:Citrate synthase n=1 Tax=Tegillarca granosa TaxID=220873 RepID=A0ABQ9ENE0_TEGGR|nr:hypothetical protein KUTeg_015674 [Tegillarca granosa]